MNTLRQLILILTFALTAAASFGADRSNTPAPSNRANNSQNAGPTFGGQSGNQNSGVAFNPPVSVVSDPAYKLTIGDQINVVVYEEPDLTCNQLIDSTGIARLNDIGETKLTGLTVRQAEHYIEEIYKERKILKRPVVTLVVTGFTPREVYVYGAVKSPGPVAFAQDSTSMPILLAIYKAGDFVGGAKTKAVTVNRRDSNGNVTPIKVDVDSMRKGSANTFLVYPGDVINVDMSIF